MATSKNKSLIFIIAVLLLTNIGVLVYFLSDKKSDRSNNRGGGNKRPPGIEAPLKEEVGFTEDQLVQYRHFRDEQMNAIKPMFDDMRKTKDSLFRMISNEHATDSTINSITDAIAQKQKAIDLRMYNHFKRIRGLCKPEQLSKYDSVVQRMMRKTGKPHKGQDKKESK